MGHAAQVAGRPVRSRGSPRLTVVHNVFISDIWVNVGPMLFAGAQERLRSRSLFALITPLPGQQISDANLTLSRWSPSARPDGFPSALPIPPEPITPIQRENEHPAGCAVSAPPALWKTSSTWHGIGLWRCCGHQNGMREVQHCGWPAATVAGDLSDDASSWGDSVLVEAHVFGDVLTGPDTVDVICLALVVDLPVDEVSWLARPAPAEAAASLLRFEWETSRRHLEHVVDSYHDRSWRRDHKGFGVYPEDHLWWATRGWLELDDALRAIDRPEKPA